MKRHFSLFVTVLCAVYISAQVTTIPAFVQKGYKGEVTVIFNPNEGNGGMKSATKCYAHTGVTVNGKQWQHAPSWRDGKHQMTKNADGNWELKITPDINTYYGCTADELVTQLSFVFNDGPNGSLEGKTASGGDIFVDLIDAGLYAKIIAPSSSQLVEQGETVHILGATSENATLTLKVNGNEVKSVSGTEIQYDLLCEHAGDYRIVLTAKTADDEKADELTVSVMKQTVQQARPEGIDMGIYYDENDPTKLTLSTFAASKTEPAKAVFVVGDFNSWQLSSDYQMKRDGNYFWLVIDNLEPQKEYAFQYAVVRSDGTIKRISDLYSTKLLHPDDRYEPKQLDPSLMAYPSEGDSYVTVVQTQKPEYQWSDATLNFQRPDKNNLIIYELWVYDYTPERSFRGLINRLDYIKNLGVNAIELMPVCEFDGNYNWGYSPNHYFAVDKAYGSENDFCTLIDECHKRGMAVIMDMVFNHATGLNPMNKIYPYGADLSQNPWFCVEVPHGDNVYEHWNHDFEPARKMFTRALQYWLREFHVDGYRMDLSHGLCGCGLPSSYDHQKTMDNLTYYYQNGVLAAGDTEKHGEPYFILEHWGQNMGSQRPKLVEQGMLCWQNTNNAYSQTAMGWLKDGDGFTDANRDGYVSYCESHDEERNFYKAKEWGNGFVKTDENFRLSRIAMNIAFNVLLNGPHMIWQFEEVGYDYSINSTRGSSTISDGNRTSIKEQPYSHGYFAQGVRMSQYRKIAQAIRLRTELAPEVFAGNPKSVNIGGGKEIRTILWGEGENAVLVVGNFSADKMKAFMLPDGTWYNYYEGRQQTAQTMYIFPGELLIFTGKQYTLPYVPDSYEITTDVDDLSVINPQKSATIKMIRDGKFCIILPEGSQYNALGQKIK